MTRRTNKIKTGAVLALALCSLSASVAAARPLPRPNASQWPALILAAHGPASTPSHQTGPLFSPHASRATVPVPKALRPRLESSGDGGGEIVVASSAAGTSSFDWGDAGIGAGGVLGLVMILLGGGLVLASRRARRREPTYGASMRVSGS